MPTVEEVLSPRLEMDIVILLYKHNAMFPFEYLWLGPQIWGDLNLHQKGWFDFFFFCSGQMLMERYTTC